MDAMKREDESKFIISLKDMKKDGSLDSEDNLKSQERKWRNTVDYLTLESWLKHDSEQVRLHALELLTISKKSTLSFTNQELQLISAFLRCNLREKIEHVPLIKKVLKRLDSSYAVYKRQLEKENKFKELQKLHSELPISPENVSENLLNVQANVQSYRAFVETMHKTCLRNLYPGAVNIRKKSSLQILCLMDEILCEDLKDSLWNLAQFKDLFECLLLDTYEVNKDMAFRLIKSSKLVESFFDTKEKLLELVNVAVQMGNSIRPLDSITAAYMLKISMLSSKIQDVLLELIEMKETNCMEEKTAFCMITLLKNTLNTPVKLATENIVIASSKHSLYGYVSCIHNILSTINLSAIVSDDCWRNLLSDLVNMCFELNTAVSQIVNNSSPEGHLPMDLNPRHLDDIVQESEDIVITPQMVLLCSWRTVKEISLFFGYLTSNASIYSEKSKTGLLSENQLKEIGNQLVTLLCETKHRGAFEQAHVGFGQLCSRLWHLEEEHASLKRLPKSWLQQLLLAVIGLTAENSKLCATRRSAGVPFMVQALVTSEIKKRADPTTLILNSVMRILLKLSNVEEEFDLDDAENLLFHEALFEGYEKDQYLSEMGKTEKSDIQLNEITEIKTHSLNILRALYRHCQLGELVKDYIAEGFITAFKCYDGKSWAERNAATLLFSSLVVRIFGVQRTKDHINLTLHNKMTGKMFFEKFPSLLPFLLNELKIFVKEPEHEIKAKIQSILLILSRLYPGVNSEEGEEDWKIDEFLDLVSQCGKSRVYKTRELAARALVPLITEKNVLPVSSNLIFVTAVYIMPTNLMHGYTLQLLELVRSPHFVKVELPTEKIQRFLYYVSHRLIADVELTNEPALCYPVLTSTLEIFIELSKINVYSWMYKDSAYSDFLKQIQKHLTNPSQLDKRPGIELYEKTALNLLIASLDNANCVEPLISNEYVAAQFWEKILGHKNPDVLIVAWTKLMYIVQKTNSPMLYDLGFMTVIKNLDEPVEDPDLQDAIFQFVYDAFVAVETSSEHIQYTFVKEEDKCYMSMHVFTKLCQQLKKKTFYPRGEFFKLFGKSFGYILNYNKNGNVPRDAKKIVYSTFLSHSDMEANIDCRLGISEVLFDIYIDDPKKHDDYFVLNWWTILLNLLYDDNAEVRSNAAQIVCRLLPETKLDCDAIIVDTFFIKFAAAHRQNVEVVVAALFCWSMTSAAVVLEEMDETDVFNKSSNYESFEPLQITNYCMLHLKSIFSKRSPDSVELSKPVKDWLQKQLNLDDNFTFSTFHDLMINYRAMIPTPEPTLARILDPTYSAKLIKELAYTQLRAAVMSNNESNSNDRPAAN